MTPPALIVVTSASGRQNSHLLPHLASDTNHKLRLVVNTTKSRDALSSRYPSAEVVQADLTEPSQVRSLVADATTVYHVGPPFHPKETEIGYNIIDACVSESRKPGSKFQHFVYSSVLNTQLRKLMNHDCKRYVEEYIMESGLNYTILQPSHFIDNLPIALMHEKGFYPAPYDPEVKFSFTALKDLGEAAAKVIREGEKHYLAQYPLCSTMPMSYTERIAIYERISGKDIEVKRLSYEEACGGMVARLMGDGEKEQRKVDGIQRLLLYYDNHGLRGSPNVCEWLLGRKPTSVEEWTKSWLEENGKS